MTQPLAASSGPMSSRPRGRRRGVLFVLLISIITLGIYTIYWAYKTGAEIEEYSGAGLGGVLWLVIWIVLNPVMWFVAPSEVGKLYSRAGQHPPVTGITGLWLLLPLIGWIIWVAKVQGALNRFWIKVGPAA